MASSCAYGTDLVEPTKEYQQLGHDIEHEKLTVSDDKNVLTSKAADPKIYPDAEGEELVVLGFLDDAIGTATEQIPIPLVEADDIAPPVKCADISKQFKYPLAALAVTVVSGFLVELSSSPFLFRYFPVFACFFQFCGAVPSLKASLDKMANAVIPRLEEMEVKIQESSLRTRQKASSAYDRYVSLLRNKKQQALELFGRKKSETSMKAYDPPNNIEQILDDSSVAEKTEENGESSHTQNVSGGRGRRARRRRRYVPIMFRSKRHFDLLVTLPLLTMALIMQLSFVLACQLFANRNLPTTVIKNKWSPLTLSAQTFLVTCFQMYVAYVMSKASRLAKVINARRKKRGKSLNFFKKQVARCMEKVKSRLLALIKFAVAALRITGGITKLFGNKTGVKMIEKEADGN